MPTNREIRHQNLLHLIEAAGSIQAFADKIERSHSQVSQLKNQSLHHHAPRARGIGDVMARHIEASCKLPPGWMDTPHGQSSDVAKPQSAEHFSARGSSLAARLDALSPERQARAYALLDLTLRVMEEEERANSATAKPGRRTKEA